MDTLTPPVGGGASINSQDGLLCLELSKDRLGAEPLRLRDESSMSSSPSWELERSVRSHQHRLGHPLIRDAPPSFWADTPNSVAPENPYECLGIEMTAGDDTRRNAMRFCFSNRQSRQRNSMLPASRMKYVEEEISKASRYFRSKQDFRPFKDSWDSLAEQSDNAESPPQMMQQFWWHAPNLKAPSNPYDVLGLDQSVDLAHVYRAVQVLLRDWDPDGVQDSDVRQRATFVHKKIIEAFETIRRRARKATRTASDGLDEYKISTASLKATHGSEDRSTEEAKVRTSGSMLCITPFQKMSAGTQTL